MAQSNDLIMLDSLVSTQLGATVYPATSLRHRKLQMGVQAGVQGTLILCHCAPPPVLYYKSVGKIKKKHLLRATHPMGLGNSLPNGGEEKGVLEVGSIPVAIFPSC